MERKKITENLLSKKDLLQRGWNSRKIRRFLPKPIYISGVPYWKESDVGSAESSLGFYLYDGVEDGQKSAA